MTNKILDSNNQPINVTKISATYQNHAKSILHTFCLTDDGTPYLLNYDYSYRTFSCYDVSGSFDNKEIVSIQLTNYNGGGFAQAKDGTMYTFSYNSQYNSIDASITNTSQNVTMYTASETCDALVTREELTSGNVENPTTYNGEEFSVWGNSYIINVKRVDGKWLYKTTIDEGIL